MKTKFLAVMAGMAILVSACSKNDDGGSGTNVSSEMNNVPQVTTIEHDSYFFDVLHNTMSTANKSGNDHQAIYTNDAASLVVNPTGSKLHRNSNGITVNWTANNSPNLDPSGHAVTLWVLVWHSADDAFAGMHPYAMYRLGGKVLGNNNSMSITGTLLEGQSSDYYFTGPGSMTFQDAENDFLVFISKSHGPKDPMYMPAQILTFGGGCDGDPDGGGPLAPCAEWLYSIHF